MLALEATNQTLQGQDVLLTSVNAAAQCLVANEDLAEAIPAALRILGEGTRQDRVYIFENTYADASEEVLWNIPYEWTATGIPTSAEISDKLPLPMNAFPPHVVEPLREGNSVQFLTREIGGTAQKINKVGQTKSLIAVSINVSGQWWGVLGFDDCTTERRWSESETAVLETAAACIGSAIERDCDRQEKEAAAKAHVAALTERDRILEATASAANIMLTEDNFERAVEKALKIVGEGLNVDRVNLVQHFQEQGEIGYHKALPNEWVSPGIPVQAEHPELMKISDRGMEFAVEALKQGEVFGGVVEELPEPFRSSQLELGVKSTYAVPVLLDDQYWGMIGIDDCHNLTRRSESELEALITLANCISNAIGKERDRQAKEAAAEARAAEIEAHNQALVERDRILETTATAANVMLTTDDFKNTVGTALKIVGEGLEIDRVLLGQHIEASSEQELNHIRFLYEWVSPNISLQTQHSELAQVSDEGIEDIVERLRVGEIFGGIVDEMQEPFRSGQLALGVQSTYGIPINVNGRFWGVVSLDDCHKLTRRSEAELEAFKTLANSIGNAIDRDQSRQEKEAAAKAHVAELTERDRILEATASAANLLLTADNFSQAVDQALQIVGEGLDVDRIVLGEYFWPQKEDAGYHQFLHEWASSNTASQTQHAELAKISDSGVENLIEKVKRGEVFGGIVEEMQEPFRSSQIELGVKSTYAVSVMVDGQYWGLIGFDDCHNLTRRGESELEALKTLANCIGSAISRDRTQVARKAQEDSVRAAEERYRNLIEFSTEGIYRLELDEPISRSLPVREQVEQVYNKCYGAEANDAFAAMYGHNTAADMLGWRLTDIHVEASEKNVEFLSEWLSNPDCRISNSESEEHDIAGNTHYFLNNVIGIVEDNYLVRIWGTQTDVTELKKNQKAREAAEKAVLAEQEKAARNRAAKLAETNEAISRTLTTLATNPELGNFLSLLVQELSEVVGAVNTGLFLYDADANTLHRQIAVQDGNAYQGAIPRDCDMLRHPFPADITSAWRTILEAPQPITFAETGVPQASPSDFWWEESIAWHISEGHQEMACARLKVGDIPIGFIGFCFREKIAFSAEQLELIQALANQATLAIHLTHLAEDARQTAILQEQEKAARDRVTELAKTNEALGQTLSALTTTPELDDFLGQVLCTISEPIQACKALLFLYEEDTHTLHAHLSVHDGQQVYKGTAPSDPEMFHHPIPADLSPAWDRIIRSSKPWTLDENNPADADLWWPASVPWNQAEGHCAATCAVMKVGGNPIGFIALTFRSLPVLTNEQLEFIQALTNQATLAIHLTRLAEQSKTAALSNALTNERNRLAREIHDTLAQAFTGVSLQLEAARSALTKAERSSAAASPAAPPALDQAKTYILRARDLSRQGLSEARRSVRALRSQALETDTLPIALRKVLSQTNRDTGLNTHLYIEGTPQPLPDDIQLNLLRISQEAITNTLRHAQAAQIDLTLSFTPTEVQLRIVDDGTGFTPNLKLDSGFGLIGIRERIARFHGTFELLSSPGIGTTLEASIPLTSPIIPTADKLPE